MVRGLAFFVKNIRRPVKKTPHVFDAVARMHSAGARGDEEVAERRPLTADDLDPNILRHMSQTLGFRLTEILRLVASNTPHGATATYHLLCARLNAHRTAATRAKSAPNNVQVGEPTSSGLAKRPSHARLQKHDITSRQYVFCRLHA